MTSSRPGCAPTVPQWDASRQRLVSETRAVMEQLHEHMDGNFRAYEHDFASLAAEGDVDNFWMLWSMQVEAAFLELLTGPFGTQEYTDELLRKCSGRGSMKVVTRTLGRTRLDCSNLPALNPPSLTRLRKQLRRIEQLQGAVRTRLPLVPVTASGHSWWSCDMRTTWQRFYRCTSDADDRSWLPRAWHLIVRIRDATDPPAGQLCALSLLRQHMRSSLQQLEAADRAARRRAPVSGPASKGDVFARLRDDCPQPLRCVRDPVSGQVVAEHERVDAITRAAWTGIYEGQQHTPRRELLQRFFAEYGPDAYEQADEEPIAPITGADVHEACQRAAKTAGGVGGWTPADWHMLSSEACAALALLLNNVEGTGRWPASLRTGRLAFLAKEGGDPLDPLCYRVLTILPNLYRRWASLRLRQLREWVLRWAPDECFAGVPGKGAADAWWAEGAELEVLRLSGVPYVGGMVDLVKCFDTIPRDIVYALLLRAGLPRGILRAYRSYLEGLQVLNTLEGGVGREFTKECGLPQGDPWSMAMISLLVRPWLLRLKRLQVVPRAPG